MTDAEIDALADGFKPVVIPNLVPFIEKDGEPIAFGLALARPQRGAARQSLGRDVPRLADDALEAQDEADHAGAHPPARRAAGVARQGDRLGALSLDLEQGRGGVGIGWGEAGWLLEDNTAIIQGLTKTGFTPVQDLPAARPPGHMRALVTGATGFVGGHLVDRLLARGDDGHRAGALARQGGRPRGARRPAGARRPRRPLGPGRSHRRRRTSSITSAALTGAVDEAEFLAANRDGTANVVHAARRATAGTTPRFVLVSSMAAGGPADARPPRTAPMATMPRSPCTAAASSPSEMVLRDEPTCRG